MEWLKYNTAGQVLFTVLLTANSRNAQANPTLAAGDVTVSKDGGAFANIATLPDDLPVGGVQVRIQLSAAELTCKILTIRFSDQTATDEWDEQYVQVCTYGNASAFLVFDMSQATPAVNVTQAAAGVIADATFAADTYPRALRTGTVNAGAAGYADLDGSASAVDNFYTGCSVKITSGPGAGQSRTIVLYTGATKRAYVDKAWATNPTGASTYLINAGKLTIDISNVGLAAGFGADTITLAASASTVNDFYDGAKIMIISGTGAGQGRIIKGYVGGTKVATITDGWAVVLDATSLYAIISLGDVEVGLLNSGAQTDVQSAMTTQGYTTTRAGYLDTLNGLVAAVWGAGTRTLTGFGTLVADVATAVWGAVARTLTSLSGLTTDANLVSIDGQTTVGNNATLNLKKLTIINSVVNGDAVVIQGNGTGAGAKFIAGASGGNALDITSMSGDGIHVAASGSALYLDAYSYGIYAIARTGTAMYLKGKNYGLECYGEGETEVPGTGHGAIIASIADYGHGLILNAGSDSGNSVLMNSPAGDGINIVAYVNGMSLGGGLNGVRAVGGTGSGMSLLKGSGGHDLTFETPDCTMPVTTDVTNPVDANLISIDSETTVGNNATLNLKKLSIINASDDAVVINGDGLGIGVRGTLHAIQAVGGTGSGMSLRKGSGGHDLTFETPDCTVPLVTVTTDVTNTVDADVLKINGEVTAAQLLAVSAKTMATGVVVVAGFAPTTTEFETSSITNADPDFWKTRTVIFTSGALVRQARIVTGYSLVGGRGHFTVKELTQAPTYEDTFIIV